MGVRPPRWPLVMLAAFTLLATVSILQGVADVVIPVLRGEESFGLLFQLTERYGPLFLIGYVFVHNLGLACLVPGYGFLAAYFEKRTVNRTLIGILLAGSVVASLLVAGHLILTAPMRFDLPLALGLLLAEGSAVLVLAFAGARELRGFVPTRAYAWSLLTPYRRLRLPLAYSTLLLLLLAVFETYVVLAA